MSGRWKATAKVAQLTTEQIRILYASTVARYPMTMAALRDSKLQD